MKIVEHAFRLTLIATLVLGGAMLTVSKAESLGGGEGPTGQMWVQTHAANTSSAARCAAGEVCKELCMFVDGEEHGLGSFRCFPG